MKASDVQSMQNDQLAEHVRKTREDLFNLKFQHATGELENTAKIGNMKKELARALTVARQRSIQIKANVSSGE